MGMSDSPLLWRRCQLKLVLLELVLLRLPLLIHEKVLAILRGHVNLLRRRLYLLYRKRLIVLYLLRLCRLRCGNERIADDGHWRRHSHDGWRHLGHRTDGRRRRKLRRTHLHVLRLQ